MQPSSHDANNIMQLKIAALEEERIPQLGETQPIRLQHQTCARPSALPITTVLFDQPAVQVDPARPSTFNACVNALSRHQPAPPDRSRSEHRPGRTLARGDGTEAVELTRRYTHPDCWHRIRWQNRAEARSSATRLTRTRP